MNNKTALITGITSQNGALRNGEEEKLIKEDKSEGLLILDATEPKKAGLIAAMIENYYLAIDLNDIKLIELTLQPF